MNTYPEFVDAFAIVKLAAARANTAAGAMQRDRLAAIEKAYRRSGTAGIAISSRSIGIRAEQARPPT